MLFTFCIYFIIFSFIALFLLIISSDTRNMPQEEAQRLEYLNEILVNLAPVIMTIALLLIPTVIICGV